MDPSGIPEESEKEHNMREIRGDPKKLSKIIQR